MRQSDDDEEEEVKKFCSWHLSFTFYSLKNSDEDCVCCVIRPQYMLVVKSGGKKTVKRKAVWSLS